jgi:hypothetical protein
VTMRFTRPALAGILLLAAAAAVTACSPAEPTPTPAAPTPVPGSPAPSPAVVPASPLPSPTPALPSTAPTPAPTPSGPVFSFDPNASADPGPTLAPGAPFALLDGLPASGTARLRLPVAVTVDDNVQARPQYGFNAASIVYQSPADGGETRYMMVFQERQAKRIEPVRSGRPYFVNWASEYRGAFAHYGGDAKTLAYLPRLHGKVLWNVDALYGSAKAFHRDRSRVAPHNGVTSTAAVRRVAVRRGAPAALPEGSPVRLFADDLPLAERPAKASITVPYNRGASSYTYDRERNRYLRSVAGRAQVDAADGRRVTARNVVVLFMRYSIDPESEPGYHRPVFDHIGSGRALVFHDGHVYKGTWKKPSAAALTRFYDKQGAEIPLVRGPIFIQIEPLGAKVRYKAAS